VGGLLQEQHGSLACEDPAFEYHSDFFSTALRVETRAGVCVPVVEIVFGSSRCVLQVQRSSLVCEDLVCEDFCLLRFGEAELQGMTSTRGWQ
jgi:hypothetical protein